MKLLIELGTEDLPARYVVPLAEALGVGIAAGLVRHGIPAGAQRTFATPRRIAVLIEEVARQQPERRVERQGPALTVAVKDGQPTPAGLGFARSCGVEFSALGEREGKLFFSSTVPGRPTAELLPEIFDAALKQMDELVPKRMRWGEEMETFVRPVHWILALLGNEVIPLARFGVQSGAVTYGHRFHAPGAIQLKEAGDYEAALLAAKVQADGGARRAAIRRQVEAEAARLGGTARITEPLLEEVAALVEWPVALSGRVEERFMALPSEVIVATIEINQRSFTVFDAEEKLIPAFVAISNIESKDAAQVIVGNERVVRPRLADAMFFWEQDLSRPLESYGPRLSEITFHASLGTVADKVARGSRLAADIAERLEVKAAVVEHVRRAAALCKNDLVTRMVYEFPELQGIMGGEYASRSGEPIEVAQAIREHYLPVQQGTPIPRTLPGRILALADKLDTLAAIFLIGQKPTASKDPFALRRAAIGVLRICIEGGLPLDLAPLLRAAVWTFPARSPVAARKPSGAKAANSTAAAGASSPAGRGAQSRPAEAAADPRERVLGDLQRFLLERLRGYYEGLPAEMFDAVRALDINAPHDFDARLQALRAFWAQPAAKNLAAAHKRVRNILRQAGVTGSGRVDPDRFAHAAEKNLWARLGELKRTNARADYGAKLTNLANLREPVDSFFDAVLVNDENAQVRANRLALLSELDAACREVADISCLPG